MDDHPVPGQRQDLGPSRTKTRHDGLVSQRRGLPPDCGRNLGHKGMICWLVVWNSRGLNTFQLVRPSQLSVEGYVPRFRHGTDPGDLSGLGRCGLCFLPWKSLASDSSNWQPGQVQWTIGRGSWLSDTDWCGGGATVPGSCHCLWSQHLGAPSCCAIVGELVQTDWCLQWFVSDQMDGQSVEVSDHQTQRVNYLQTQLPSQDQQLYGQIETQTQSIQAMLETQLSHIWGVVSMRLSEEGEWWGGREPSGWCSVRTATLSVYWPMVALVPDFVFLIMGLASALSYERVWSSAKTKMVVLLVSFSVVRVGEAFPPGPVDAFCDTNFVLETANPSGLQSDAGCVVANMSRGDFWAMSETQLGSWELQSFISGLCFVQLPFCEICRHAKFDVMSQYCRPQSHMICMHASCMALQFSNERLENVVWCFLELSAVPVRRSTRVLDHLLVPVWHCPVSATVKALLSILRQCADQSGQSGGLEHLDYFR